MFNVVPDKVAEPVPVVVSIKLVLPDKELAAAPYPCPTFQ